MRTVGELRAALEDYGDDAELHVHIDLFAPAGVSVTLDPGLIVEVRSEDDPPAACLMIGEWKPG